MSDNTNKLNIFLIKSEYAEFGDIISNAIPFQIDEKMTFFTERTFPKTPSWLQSFFLDSLNLSFGLSNSNAKGILLIKIAVEDETRIFAIVFGHGRFLINQETIEERFGLKVVLNTIDPKNLRSIDKLTFGSNPKQSKEQINKEGEVSNFGIDIEQDLLNSVTGKSNDSYFGRTVSGKDALSVAVKVDINEIDDFLHACFEKYQSDTYKENFDWVDQVKDIRDISIIGELDDILVDRFNNYDLTRIWMATPELIDWVDISGFKYIRPKRGELYSDLNIQEFMEIMDGTTITKEILKKNFIYSISSRSEEISDKWSIYKCIYSEIEHKGNLCILNNGKWFNISSSFTETILNDFASIPEMSLDLPEYSHSNEGEYNSELITRISNSCCLDRQLVHYGGGHSSVEFCDLLTKDKKLIHIKMYSGSAQLSHLFAQGVVSAELFLQDPIFRQKLNELLPDDFKLENIYEKPNPEEYEIVFAIISKSVNPLEIPFFSKVTLRNARRRLNGYGYKVSKKKILRPA